MPKAASLERLDPAELRYAIQQLIAENKVTAARVVGLAKQRSKRITELQGLLAGLRVGLAERRAGRGPGRPPGRASGKVARRRKRKFTMTPKARAARKLQGRYLGMLRKLTGSLRTRVKAVAKKKGVASALKIAAKLVK